MSEQGLVMEKYIREKLDKRPRESKKFWAFILGLFTTAGLLGAGFTSEADVWVMRILAGGLVANCVGYVLGVVALERVVLRGFAVVRPGIDDALDKAPLKEPHKAPWESP